MFGLKLQKMCSSIFSNNIFTLHILNDRSGFLNSCMMYRLLSRTSVRSYSAAAQPRIPEPNRQVKVKHTKLFINNEWHTSKSGKTFAVHNPATGKLISEVQEAGKADVELAVRAASEAFKAGSEWRRMDVSHRGLLLHRLADAIDQNAQELASLESLNSGIPYQRTYMMDIPWSSKHFRYYAGWANKNHGKVIPIDGDYFCFTRHEPVGVCAQIIPWNVPMIMAAWKLAPALAMGNTVILKPAEQTPLTALYLADLFHKVGFPPGVINVLPGFGEAGAALVDHAGVDKVAFTGSTEVGQSIMADAARSNLKRVSLELGGKSPNIILSDADFDYAIQLAHTGVFFNQGQACCAGTRLFVEESIYDQFVERSVELAKKRRVGDPFDSATEQGPQVSEEQLKRILGYVQSGRREGAKLCTGGSRFGDVGYFVEPTVFADVRDDMQIAKDEIFGPVMSILKFRRLEELIERANATKYGLAAGVFTKDIGRALHIAQGLRAGSIWVNCYFAMDAAAPFGGYKMSGIGRECGEYGLQQYTEVKTVTMPIIQKNS